MITWEDTINIIMKTYMCTQAEIAEQLGVSTSTVSKVKSGKQNPPPQFAVPILYKKIFDTTAPRSLAYGKDEKYHLSVLKDIISTDTDFIKVKNSMSGYWNEENYKTFVENLLEQTRRNTPAKGIPDFAEDDNKKAPCMTLCHIPPEKPLVFGREDELDRLSEIFENSNCAVLTGIGGIGKSQIALAYAYTLNRSGGWTIQHIICEGSETLQQAILRLQFTDLPNAETFDYAVERLKSCQGNTLIILDNLNKPFSNSDQRTLQQLLKCNRHIRILITSRYSLLQDKRCIISVLPLGDNELLKLYEYHRFEDHSDHSSYIVKRKNTLERLFSLVERHTLMIVLLAKLPSRCFWDEGEILEKLESGLSLPAEDIAVSKDDAVIEATISEIAKKLFDISQLEECQKAIMMYMLVIPASGIDLELFTKLTGCRKRDIVSLKKSCWLIVDEETLIVRLHPLICEAVLNLDEAKVFWCLQNYANDENSFDENDTDADEPTGQSVAISEPDNQPIDKRLPGFENKDAKRFIERVLAKHNESLQGEEEWHMFHQIMACLASRVVFRHLLDSDLSEQIPFSIVDLLSDENKDALITINKTLTKYANTDPKDSKYIINVRQYRKDSN